MKSISLTLVLLTSLILSTNTRADNVMTIYFGGTTMLTDMWISSSGFFDEPSTVEMLYHYQKVGQDNPNHFKAYIDGLQGIEAAIPNWGQRSWDGTYNEAKAHLDGVLSNLRMSGECDDIQPCLVLNIDAICFQEHGRKLLS